MQYNGAGNMQQDRDFSGHASASYESYPQLAAYSSASSAYFGARNDPFEAAKAGPSIHRHNPSGPPSPSPSQIFENPSSNMSTASGASGQSTASSADGSPYANPQHSLPYQEKWEPLGLGLGPEIVNTEVYNPTSFQGTSFDNEFMLDDSKFPHCVGEYEKNFSPSFPTSHSVTSSMSAASALQSHLPALCSLPLAMDAKPKQRNVTIDSILEEANSRIRNPKNLISPVSSASVTTSPTIGPSKQSNASPVGRRKSFKSPVIPASANSPQHSPRQLHSYGRPARPPTSPSQVQFHNTQNSFFCQSSGRFVAPLESSCWFS